MQASRRGFECLVIALISLAKALAVQAPDPAGGNGNGDPRPSRRRPRPQRSTGAGPNRAAVSAKKAAGCGLLRVCSLMAANR